MKELIEKLYTLIEPCSDIDVEIAIKLLGYTRVNRLGNWPDLPVVWDYYLGKPYESAPVHIPKLTHSINDAVRLVEEVLPDHDWILSPKHALVYETDPDVDGFVGYGFNAATSLCIATIEAKVGMK